MARAPIERLEKGHGASGEIKSHNRHSNGYAPHPNSRMVNDGISDYSTSDRDRVNPQIGIPQRFKNSLSGLLVGGQK